LSLGIVMMPRAAKGLFESVLGGGDRRLEHFEVARFLSQFYEGETVVLNDIGIATWEATGVKIEDLYGLGNNAAAALRKNGGMTPLQAENWARANHADIAILSACWRAIGHSIPDSWKFVALWRIPRNVVYGDFDIGFFALRPTAVEPLEAKLKTFAPDKNIEVYFSYDGTSPIFGKTSADIRSSACKPAGPYRGPMTLFDRIDTR
jgi:hypothetical protein